MEKVFKIQIPNNLIRDNTFSDIGFVLYGKLLQLYYMTNKSNPLELDYKSLMYYLCIEDNRTFKKVCNELFSKGLILTEIKTLPKNKLLEVKMNTSYIHSGNMFTQITKNIFDRKVIKTIEYTGIRILYYLESYINREDPNGKKYAHPSEETIAKHIGTAKATVIKYNKIIEDMKFMKIEKDELSDKNEWIRKGEVDIIYYTKYNNKYYLKLHNIDKYVSKESA